MYDVSGYKSINCELFAIIDKKVVNLKLFDGYFKMVGKDPINW